MYNTFSRRLPSFIYITCLCGLAVTSNAWTAEPDTNSDAVVVGIALPNVEAARDWDYTHVDLPAYLGRGEIRETDNTPDDNPLTNAGARLGRVLFYDRQLSKNNTVACASCHLQKAGFADPSRLSKGIEGRRTRRNAMGLVNLRYTHVDGFQPGLFWDERAATLEDQVLMPIQSDVEMGMKLDELEGKLARLPYYPPLFKEAFGSPDVTRDRLAMALAQFLRTINSFQSRFDEGAAAAGGDLEKDFENFTELENQGKSLFVSGPGGVAEFSCAMCHVPPTFHMPAAANIGLEAEYTDAGLGELGRPSNDFITPSNDGKFKAASLRNVELTAPYMHDGRFKTLAEVVKHYSSTVLRHENLGLAFELERNGKPARGFQFSDEQQAALVAFLKTLTDRSVVSDPRFSDPFLSDQGSRRRHGDLRSAK